MLGDVRAAADDRFSSHAPFHFDLSILDLYVALKHGATLVLIGEEIGKDPERLAPLIAERADHDLVLGAVDPGCSRSTGSSSSTTTRRSGTCCSRARSSRSSICGRCTRQLPKPRYFNLYGPTETNVCTFYEVPRRSPEERVDAVPDRQDLLAPAVHGRRRRGTRRAARARKASCASSGRGVMQGYWDLPEQTARGFLIDAAGVRWYQHRRHRHRGRWTGTTSIAAGATGW